MAALIGYAVRADHVPAKLGDVYRSVVDPGRAKKELGWEAWTDLTHGLTATIEWQRGWEPSRQPTGAANSRVVSSAVGCHR
jgi:UDP-glucose 4-epimerase